jgi:hypothetical protein
MSDNQTETQPAPPDPFVPEVEYDFTRDGRSARDSGVTDPIYGTGVLDLLATEAIPAGGRVGAMPPAFQSLKPGQFFFEVDQDPLVRPRMWIGKRIDPIQPANEALVIDNLPTEPTSAITLTAQTFDGVGNLTVTGTVTPNAQVGVGVFISYTRPLNGVSPPGYLGPQYLTWTPAVVTGTNWTITFPALPAGTYTTCARQRSHPNNVAWAVGTATYVPVNILLP